MSWLLVLLLTAAAFASAALAFRLRRKLWSTVLAALVFGLAGYAFQARPDLAAAPPEAAPIGDPSAWGVVDARKEMVADSMRSRSDKVLIADALTRQGQFANAATMLRGATQDDSYDAEAWLALGNVLVEHADGTLTPAALYAYRRASAHAPQSPASGYFLGLSLIREGRLMEGRQVWASTLENTPADEPARSLLEERLGRLDSLLSEAGALPAQEAPSAAQ